MTDPQEMIGAVTNLEQDLRDLGWRPVEMIDEKSGMPFTRWFPPKLRVDKGESPVKHRDSPHSRGMEGCLLSMYVSRNLLPAWFCSCGQCHNTLDLQNWRVRRDPDKPYPYDRIDYPYTHSGGDTQ